MTQTVPDISPLMPMHQDPLLVAFVYTLYIYVYIYIYDTFWCISIPDLSCLLFPCSEYTSYLLSIFSIANTIASVRIHTWVCVAKIKTWTWKLLMKRAHEALRIGSDEFTNSVRYNSMVSCQKGPTRHAYAWQIGPFWQDTLELLVHIHIRVLHNQHCRYI